MIVPSPASVRQAAVVVSLEGAALVVVALTLAVRHLGGVEDQPWLSGYGTAGWFAIMGSAVLAAGWALWTGRRWGRGIAVFAQLLLLPVAWYMGVGSHQWLYAVPVALRGIGRTGSAVQPVHAAVAGRSGFGGQCRQLRPGHPVGDPVVLRLAADGVVQRDRVDVPVEHRP